MHIYSFLCHSMHWLCLAGFVLTVLAAAVHFVSGREGDALPLLFFVAMMFVVTDVIIWNRGDIGTLLDLPERLDQLASTCLPLLGAVFCAAFLSVAFLLTLKKLLE